ncbi:MAG: GNAT family N-acetyltransferase [candidate division Zixibacteria bacterium]|nr:GNAT family N-acetyltransferase [candidate division Zixibacteria bacterium]
MKKSPTSEVRTARLRLIPGTAAMVKAAVDNHVRLADFLGASIPKTWPGDDLRDVLPQFHERMVEDSAFENWVVWFWVSRGDSGGDVLVGDGGFMGLPDEDGTVEIGYSILPEFRRQGYAREGVAGLLAVAFGIREIDTVMAETEKDNAASIHLLEKLGFCRMLGAGETGTVWFALTRRTYEG